MTKKNSKLLLSLFCVLLLYVEPVLKCGLCVQQDFIGEINFYFSSRYQLEIACWLGMGESIQSPSQYWDLNWHGPVQALDMQPQSLFVDASPAVSGRCCFLGAIHPSLLAFPVFLPPLSRNTLSSEGRGLMKTSHLVLKVLLGGKRCLVGGWYPPLFGYFI